jgi:hypothetical protein
MTTVNNTLTLQEDIFGQSQLNYALLYSQTHQLSNQPLINSGATLTTPHD